MNDKTRLRNYFTIQGAALYIFHAISKMKTNKARQAASNALVRLEELSALLVPCKGALPTEKRNKMMYEIMRDIGEEFWDDYRRGK